MRDVRLLAGAFVFGATVAFVCLAARPVQAQVAGFPDVPSNHWAADSVARLATAGIVRGRSADPLGVQGAQKPAPPAKPGYNGNKPVTRYELAVTLYRFVQYIERANSRPTSKSGAQVSPASGADAVKRLVAGGYLPKTTPLGTQGATPVTANQLADALTSVITRTREKKTPITPDSLQTLPLENPQHAPGT